jgi:polysaccharide export outer membrane protein
MKKISLPNYMPGLSRQILPKSRLYVTVFTLLILVTYAWVPLQAQEDTKTVTGNDASSYRVQAGDILEISVWKEEGLEKDVLVRPNGGISFPLIGDLAAQGKSVEQIRSEIAARLTSYVPNPAVTVAVKQVVGNKVYVIGRVNNPGDFIVVQKIDVMQALSMAGGTTSFAKLNDIKILRRVGNRQSVIGFKYPEVVKGRNVEQNIILQSGDIVVVP